MFQRLLFLVLLVTLITLLVTNQERKDRFREIEQAKSKLVLYFFTLKYNYGCGKLIRRMNIFHSAFKSAFNSIRPIDCIDGDHGP